MQYIHQVRPDGKIDMALDLGNIKIPELDGKEYLLRFVIKTYTKVCKNISSGTEESSFNAINNFFDYIIEDDKKIIAIYLATMNHVIQEHMKNDSADNIMDLSKELGQMVLSLNNIISLYDKLVEFASKNVPINLFKEAGARPQDTPLHTYYKEDIIELLACVFISKLLAPIFGTIMNYATKSGIESRIKELHCLPIVSPLYAEACPHVIYKLKKYIEPILNKEFKENMDSISIGFTKNSIENHVFVNLIVRNFINLDIYRENSNHITAIRVGIKKSIDTQRSNMKTNKIMFREDISALPDDQKRSQLEIDSVISKTTADVPIITSVFINKTVNRFLKEYDIEHGMYDECLRHNYESGVTYNILNSLILEILFSGALSGTKSFKYLTIQDIAKLVTCSQLICASLNYYELASSMTALSSSMIKEQMTDMDQQILVGYQTKQQYRAYITKLLDSSLGPDMLVSFFTIRAKSIITSITTDTHIFNNSELLWQQQKHDNVNGTIIQFTDGYIQELCGLLNLLSIEEY
jgi:hypothetical protein